MYNYKYSNDGKLKRKSLIDDNTTYWMYTWDVQENLRKVTSYKNNSVDYEEEYFYDEAGQRIKKVTPEETTTYIYIGSNLVYEKTTKSSEEKTTDYIYAFGKLQATVESVDNVETAKNYYHSDILGSTRLVTNNQRKVVQENLFTPFGQELLTVGCQKYG